MALRIALIFAIVGVLVVAAWLVIQAPGLAI
jgi:hypothetical protein